MAGYDSIFWTFESGARAKRSSISRSSVIAIDGANGVGLAGSANKPTTANRAKSGETEEQRFDGNNGNGRVGSGVQLSSDHVKPASSSCSKRLPVASCRHTMSPHRIALHRIPSRCRNVVARRPSRTGLIVARKTQAKTDILRHCKQRIRRKAARPETNGQRAF